MLTFETLRTGNLARLPQFKNRKGERAHSEMDGSDWSLGDWCTAALGELGEAANIIKKIRRGDISLEDAREDLGREFGDTVCYLDLLSYRAGIDLGKATFSKWNEISDRIGCYLQIGPDGLTVKKTGEQDAD